MDKSSPSPSSKALKSIDGDIPGKIGMEHDKNAFISKTIDFRPKSQEIDFVGFEISRKKGPLAFPV